MSIILKVTTNYGALKGKVVVLARLKGSTVYHGMSLYSRIPPDTPGWDERRQRFTGKTQNAAEANAVIEKVLSDLESIIKARMPADGKELFAYYKKYGGTEVITRSSTLERFLEDFITEESRTGLTKNYQLYKSLLNNLRGQNMKTGARFALPESGGIPIKDIEVGDIDNTVARDFATWVRNVKKGTNYSNLNKNFHAILGRLRHLDLNSNVITYRYMRDMPKKVKVVTGRPKDLEILTLKQVDTFATMELEGNEALYRDAVMFMYHTLSRPADIMRLEERNVTFDGRNAILTYLPYKKRLTPNPVRHTVITRLNPPALEIMERYKGKSDTGALFPFDMGNPDISTPEGARAWELKKKCVSYAINSFLHRIGKKMTLPFNLHMYVFRASALSHVIDRRNENPLRIAAMAGTSVAMLEKHYYRVSDI